jgi:hypothetical protein
MSPVFCWCCVVRVYVLSGLLFTILFRLAKASIVIISTLITAALPPAAGHLARHLPLALAEKSQFRRSAEDSKIRLND